MEAPLARAIGTRFYTGVKLADSYLVGFHGIQSRFTYYVALVLLCDYIG
jgi:predicted GH43/DUF377 family glycosyl hydrolase